MNVKESTVKKRYEPVSRSFLPHQYAAIDVGSEKIYAGINGSSEVKIGATTTGAVRELAKHFVDKAVKSVAMEATGSLWISIYGILEEAGLELIVINGAHAKNLPGRKTDMQDCQWLAYLHGQGLLSGGFVPSAQIRCLRDYHRLRQDHVEMGSAHIQHMQKALDRMNLKLHLVFAQTIGVNCLRLIEGIVKGLRDPEELLALCDADVNRRLRKKLLEALEGNYLDEHVFALQQGLECWNFYQRRIAECDERICGALEELRQDRPPILSGAETLEPKKAKRDQPRKNAPKIAALGKTLEQIYGHDITKLPGITPYTAMQLLAEVGHDMSQWPTVKQFVAWLGLAPGSKQSGKRHRRYPMRITRAGRIFSMASFGLIRSKYIALGGFLRRIKGRSGPKVAIKAAARKLATLFYNVLVKGWEYVEQGLEAYEKMYQKQTFDRLAKAARAHGFTLVSAQSAT